LGDAGSSGGDAALYNGPEGSITEEPAADGSPAVTLWIRDAAGNLVATIWHDWQNTTYGWTLDNAVVTVFDGGAMVARSTFTIEETEIAPSGGGGGTEPTEYMTWLDRAAKSFAEVVLPKAAYAATVGANTRVVTSANFAAAGAGCFTRAVVLLGNGAYAGVTCGSVLASAGATGWACAGSVFSLVRNAAVFRLECAAK
jgi:hypothetical protein